MNIKIIVGILLFSYFKINAQSWCTPGSQWTYNYRTYFNIGGYLKYKYSRDTAINGKTINIINCTKSQTFPGSGGGTQISIQPDVYTYTENSVIFINRGTMNNPIYDTLYNFNAAIGDKWRCISSPNFNNGVSCSMSYLEILDTGRVVIQNQSLKWLKFNYTNYTDIGQANQHISTGVDTIYERFGTKNDLNYFSGLYCGDFSSYQSIPFTYLLCFSDNQINQLGMISNYVCPEVVDAIGIEEIYKNDERLKIINPVSKKIEGWYYNTNFRIEVVNCIGMLVFSQDNSYNNFLINSSYFENGLYYIRIIDGNEVISRKIIVNNSEK